MQTLGLLALIVIVIAFAASSILGVARRGTDEVTDESEVPAAAAVQDARGRVEVLNGSGKQGLARLATQQLRDAGFDVVQFGNARTLAQTSSVLDRIGKTSTASEIARALAISTVTMAIDTSRYVDATVILGQDWPPKKATPVEPSSWRDRLRKVFRR